MDDPGYGNVSEDKWGCSPQIGVPVGCSLSGSDLGTAEGTSMFNYCMVSDQ